MNLKNLSIKEIYYKLLSKGISKNLLDEYIETHQEELSNYEIISAKKIWNKKIRQSDEKNVKEFLYKKGYKEETINNVVQEQTGFC